MSQLTSANAGGDFVEVLNIASVFRDKPRALDIEVFRTEDLIFVRSTALFYH
jgi:hypothetical protein